MGQTQTMVDDGIRNQCHVLDKNGNRCKQKARFWVGSNPVDDYTYVCGDHVEDVKEADHVVHKL